ncbi:MAG: lipopolysaccharide biosynthesis protein [Clostridia bacterium]|nr:lipopolysaccharide biosynthesis protein [Clostridia bacterium]
MALGIIISLAYTPIMLRLLGKTEYGIYNLASSIIAYLSLLSLGFGASYIRFYSIYKRENNQDGIKRMNGLYLLVFTVMGLVSLLGGLVLASNAEIFYNDTYTKEEIEIAKVLMFFLTINLAVSFPVSVFTSYITSQEKFIFQKIINMGKTIISPAVNIVLLYLGYGSIGMVISTTVISLIVDATNIFYCFTKLGMRVSFKSPDFHLLRDIFFFSLFIAMNQLIDQINWQTDKVILGKICSGAAVAVYAVGAQINSMFTSFSTAVSSVFAPKVNLIVSKNEENMDEQLTTLFIKVGRIQWFIMTFVLLGFIFFGQFFISKWAGNDYGNAYWVALLLMAPAIIPLIQNIGIEIQRAKNKHQFRSLVYLIMAILNVGISIWFAMMWGEIGTAIGTTISLLVANGLIMNIYYQKKLGINVIEFWKSIGKTVPGMIIPIACGVCLMLFYKFNSLVDFILLALAYTVIYAISVYFLGMNKEEKDMIDGLFKKFLRR